MMSDDFALYHPRPCKRGAGAADPPALPSSPLTFSLMLAASKDKVLAELKQQSLCLRQLELEYYIKRYTNIATQVRRESVSKYTW